MPSESEPHYRRPLLPTPFHERSRALSQVDSFIPWAGYTTVDVFTTVEQEYFAIRNAASVYDLTPMVKYRIAGPGALRFLNRLVTRDIAKLRPGRVAYCVWCNDAGHLIDDGTVFCLGEGEYRLCTAERQLDWLLDSAIGFDVGISEVTEDVAALALQGPTSYSVLRKAGVAGVELLKPFELGTFTMPAAAEAPLMVSRTGFTGDLGYELWMEPKDAERVWDALFEAGRTRGIRRSVRARSTPRASRRASSCRMSTSYRGSAPSSSAPRARRSSSGSPGWWTSARAISPDAGRCSRSTSAAPGASSSVSTSRAPSPLTTRCSTPSAACAARRAA